MNPILMDIYTLPTIDFVGGATQDFAFHVYFHAGGRPFDLDDCTANFAVVNYINKNGAPLISKSMEVAQGEDTGEGVVDNILKVTLTPSDTMNLNGKYIYQITVKDTAGQVDIPNQGIMRIINNINKQILNTI